MCWYFRSTNNPSINHQFSTRCCIQPSCLLFVLKKIEGKSWKNKWTTIIYLDIINSVKFSQTFLNSTSWFVCFIGCVIEENIKYHGNTVSRFEEPNVDSCRSSCRSIDAPYFSYYDKRMKCTCKSTDAGRIAKDGIVSGETLCDDTSDQTTIPPPRPEL